MKGNATGWSVSGRIVIDESVSITDSIVVAHGLESVTIGVGVVVPRTAEGDTVESENTKRKNVGIIKSVSVVVRETGSGIGIVNVIVNGTRNAGEVEADQGIVIVRKRNATSGIRTAATGNVRNANQSSEKVKLRSRKNPWMTIRIIVHSMHSTRRRSKMKMEKRRNTDPMSTRRRTEEQLGHHRHVAVRMAATLLHHNIMTIHMVIDMVVTREKGKWIESFY